MEYSLILSILTICFLVLLPIFLLLTICLFKEI